MKVEKEYSIIGKPTPNVDDPAKVTGEAAYAIDITLPNMLYGKLLRSPYPHAKIFSINTSEAEKLPGVKCIITGKDTPGGKWGLWRRCRELADQQALATDKVRFIGDPVVALAATTEEIAEQALDLIEVEYEPLPAVFGPIEAIKDDAPMVHEDFPSNINATRHIEWVDVDKAFAEADYVRRHLQLDRHSEYLFIGPHEYQLQWNLWLFSKSHSFGRRLERRIRIRAHTC
jgi:CO/xanthine dehydrogenase Mo-binding subunit